MQSAPQHLKHCFGFTYIGLMLIVAIAGIALSGVGIVWKTEMQRENEKELRFAGGQYVAAIASYYECKVCGPHQLPKNLKDLLKDSRAPSVVHHIRKLYRDPMTRGNDWGLIKNGDRIMGVYSKSKLEPLAKPLSLDFKNKKLNATPLIKTGNPNQTNINQANANQADINIPGSNTVGANVVDLNRSDISKTNQPIKSKKPSYQDWQFVYGGGGDVSPVSPIVASPSIPNTDATKNPLQNANKNTTQLSEQEVNDWEKQRGNRVSEICGATNEEDLQRCDQVCVDSQDNNACSQCKKEAEDAFRSCVKAVN